MQFIPRSARFCIPTIIDKQDNLYTITSVFKDKAEISDINATNTLKKWYRQKGNIKVSVIPFIDTYIEPEELQDESFIYHNKNEILKFAHTSNQKNNNTLKKQQEIIQKHNGTQFRISHLQDLKCNSVIESLLNCLNYNRWKLKLIAIFIELTWNRNTFEIQMRSVQNNKNEDSLILSIFMMNNQDNQLFIKSTIMINRDVWLIQNCKKYPFNQLYWNTVALSKYWLNILYGVIIGYWQTHYSKNDTITVVPFIFKSNNIVFVWEQLKHEDKINDSKYIICEDIHHIRKGQPTQPEYKYIGINSFDGVFNMNDTHNLMARISTNEIFFMLNNENNNEIPQERLNKLTEKEMKHEEMKIEMSQINANFMRTYIAENKENINIDISNQPNVWHLIKKRLNYFFNIKKYQFGFILSPLHKHNSFKLPIYKLKCGRTNVCFQNSEMLLFVMCMAKITIYTGSVCLINKPGRIYIIDYNSLPDDNIIINSNGKDKVIIFMLRTSPYVESYDKAQFLDLNIELYNRPAKKQRKKRRRKKKKKRKKKLNGKSKKKYYKSKNKMVFADTDDEKEYDIDFVSQTTLQSIELIQERLNPNMPQDVYFKKITVNTGLDLEDINEQIEYFDALLRINKYEPFAIEITFYLGNIYEELGRFKKALKYYNTSLKFSKVNNTYYSTFTIQHKYYCIRKENNNNNNNNNNMINDLKKSTHVAICNDKASKDIRKKWISARVVEYELMGSVTCALSLCQLYEDAQAPKKWNDESLIYYKIGMNILETLQFITIQTVSIDCLVDSFNDERHILRIDKPSTKLIERKRIDIDNDFTKYIETTETIIQSYLQCLIERFRGEDYVFIAMDKLKIKGCKIFYEFEDNAQKYNENYEKYLQMEIDSVFEMLYNYWCYNEDINISNDEMADVYNNYAAFLCDKLQDYENALLWLEEASELNPLDVVTHWNISETYEKMSQYDTAKEYYQRTLNMCCQTGNDVEIQQMTEDVMESMQRIERASKAKSRTSKMEV